MLDPDSPVLRRAQAIGHTLWVTPFREDERWPCGELVVQSERDSGLPAWTAQDRSIEDTDVVVWYAGHATHDVGHEAPGHFGHIVGPELRKVKW
jgi:Cu2+-containing amine oxidase